MRRILGLVALGLSAFLIVTALMGWFYAPSTYQKTPLNTDSLTWLDGTATYLGQGPNPVIASSKNVVDGKASTDSVAAFTSNTCLMWDRGQTDTCVSADAPDTALINAAEDSFSTDRTSGMAVDDKHEGLINKFPFDAKKQTYPFWDGILGKAVDAEFKGEEEIDGLKVYKYQIDVPETPATITTGVEGKYSDVKTMWVEPMTGSLIKQQDDQLRLLDNGDIALKLSLGFTADQVASNVKDGKSNVSKIGALQKMPPIALILGLLSGLLGAWLVRSSVIGRREVAATAGGQMAGNPAAGTGTVAAPPAEVDATDRFFEEATEKTQRIDLTKNPDN